MVTEWTGSCGNEIMIIEESFLERAKEGESLLELLPGINVEHEAWVGDSPGRSGVWIEVYTYGKDRADALKALKLLVSRLSSSYPE